MTRWCDNIVAYGSLVEKRYHHRRADGVTRADLKLRDFSLKEGDAVYCRLCDGTGVIPRNVIIVTQDPITKCTRCGGEGLEPK